MKNAKEIGNGLLQEEQWIEYWGRYNGIPSIYDTENRGVLV